MLVLAQGETLLGRLHYWPVWQAAEKHKLPVAIHAGSAYRGVGVPQCIRSGEAAAEAIYALRSGCSRSES